MATVAKSWLVTTCPTCKCRRVFFLSDAWVLTCSECGTTLELDKTGVLKD